MPTIREDITSLETKKRQILRDISSKFDYSGSIDHLDLAAVRLYNETVEESERLQTHSRRISIDVIPPELLLEVLLQATAPAGRGTPMIDRVLELTLVCTKWSDAILGTARFWTCIELVGDMEDAEAKLALCLQLSRDQQLTLIYTSDPNFNRIFLPQVVPHARRVASVIRRILGPGDATEEKRLLEHCIIANNLIEVGIESRRGLLARDYIYQRPLWYLGKDWGPLVSFDDLGDKLRQIDLGYTTVQALVALTAFKNLECVTIHIQDLQLTSNEGVFLKELDLIDMISWTRFHSRELPWSLTNRLLHCLKDTVVNLSLTLSTIHFKDTMEAIGRMSRLQELDIGLFAESLEPTSFPSIEHKTSLLTSVILRVYSTYLDAADFIMSLCRNSPLLRRLYILGQNLRIQSWKFDFRLLESLHHLALDCTEVPVMEFTDLKRLDLVASIDQVRAWRSATVSHLRCIFTSQDPGPEKSSFILDSTSWPNVESLTIRGTTPLFHIHLHLRRLHHLTLCSPYDVGICHALAMYPQNVPALREIEFQCPPDWDILFIMMEKRLALSVEGITPISELVFECAPPEEMRVPLIHLLKGHIVPRPSNFELSIQGNILLVIGQRSDHIRRCGYVSRDLHGNVSDENGLDLSVLLPYPDTAQGVLDTWYNRKTALESVLSPYFTERRLCDDQSVTLTKYSELPHEDK